MIYKKDLQEYLTDQISFYTNRKKKIEKSIKDKERVGLPASELDQFQLKIEEKHINEFTTELAILLRESDNG